MKSIRLSLVLYFLVLLTAAMGTVFALVYRTTAAALQVRQHDAERLIEQQYATQCNEPRAGLTQRLREQSHAVATLARPPLHFEALYPLGVVGLPFLSQPHLHAGLWLHEGSAPRQLKDRDPSLAEHLFRLRA